MIESLQVDIPPERYEEMYNTAQGLGKKAIKVFPLVKEAKNITDNPFRALVARGWEPKLCVTGAADFPDVSVAGNVMRTKSTFKLSIRLPPTANGQHAKKVITEAFTTDVPYNAKVTLDKFVVSSGWNAPIYSSYLRNAI